MDSILTAHSTSKNATRSLENYKAAAAQAPENISPDAPNGGKAGTGGETGGSTGGGYGGDTATWTTSVAGSEKTGAPQPDATAGDVTATGTDVSPSGTFTGAAHRVYTPAVAGVLAMGAALLL